MTGSKPTCDDERLELLLAKAMQHLDASFLMRKEKGFTGAANQATKKARECIRLALREIRK